MAFLLCGAFVADRMAHAIWRKEFRWETLKAWIFPPVLVGLAGLILCGLNPHGYNAILTPLHLLARGTGGSGGSSILMSISELTPVKGTGFFIYYQAAAAFAFVSLILGITGRRIYLLDLFLFTIAFKGAWDSARAVSMMGLFLSPGVSLHMTGFLSEAAGWFPAKVTRTPKAPEGKAETKGEEGASACAGLRPVRSPSAPHRGLRGHRRRRRHRLRRIRRNDAGVLFFPIGVRGGNHGAQIFLQGGGVPAEESHPGKDVQLLRHRRIPRLAAIPSGPHLHRRPHLQPGSLHGTPDSYGGDVRGGRRFWRNTASTISS